MSEKAGTVTKDILLELIAIGAEGDMDASETASTIRYINRYMNMIAAQGINLGFTEITSVDDTITIADGAIMGLIKNVAKIMAPQFGAIVPPELHEAARDGLKAMRRLGTSITPSQMPGTLPKGSGNDDGTYGDTYYETPSDSIVTETDSNILLE